MVDKMLVTVSDGVRSELITYSDVLWQLALQPDSNLDAPTKEDLDATLNLLTEQRLIALEAERLPASTPKPEEIQAAIRELVAAFPSAGVFEARLRRVGFTSITDPNFERIIEQRVAIDKYLDFRFRSFTVITPQEVEKFYTETYAPEFQKTNAGTVVTPKIEQARKFITEQLTEDRVAAAVNRFVVEAKERAIITNLNPIN